MIINTHLKLKKTTDQDILRQLSDDTLTTYIMLQKSKIPLSINIPLNGNIPSSDSVKKSLVELSKLGLIHLD